MIKLTHFKQKIKNLFISQSGSLLRTIIYTIGHFIIAATCVMFFTGATIYEGLTDAIIEPILNGIWYYILDRYWASKNIPYSK
tara:strand:- start:168 stop:416 length:249 start_codon:yes stop_codon:yes gene_type:complete